MCVTSFELLVTRLEEDGFRGINKSEYGDIKIVQVIHSQNSSFFVFYRGCRIEFVVEPTGTSHEKILALSLSKVLDGESVRERHRKDAKKVHRRPDLPDELDKFLMR